MNKTQRQSESEGRSSLLNWLALPALVAIGAMMWWLGNSGDPALPSADGSANPQTFAAADAARPSTPSTVELPMGPDIAPDPLLKTPEQPAPPERTLAELERQFLGTQEKAAQLEAVEEIAGFNDAGAVETLARIFSWGRDAEVKEAVLARLADIDPAAAPVARIAVLEGALFGQPRNVRLTALDGLGQSEDPRALIVLRRAAREDPDKMIREAAAALAEAVEKNER